MSRFSRRSVLASAATLPAVLMRRQSNAQTAVVPGKILFVRDGSIWQWQGGEATRILEADNISDPRWSPEGNRILYVRNGNSFSDLYLLDLTTNIETRLTFNQAADELGSYEYATNSSWAMDPDWASTGLIGFVSDLAAPNALLGLWLMESATSSPYMALEPGVEDDISGLALSANGTFATYTVRVAFGDGTGGTYVALRDLNTGVAYPVAQSSGNIFDSAISPDGKWVAMAIRSEEGMTDLWLVDIATSDRARLTRNENALAPRWSSDGGWFGYLRMDEYEFELWASPFIDGELTEPRKLIDEGGIDSRSGLSWHIANAQSEDTDTATP
jgi:TolB protein